MKIGALTIGSSSWNLEFREVVQAEVWKQAQVGIPFQLQAPIQPTAINRKYQDGSSEVVYCDQRSSFKSKGGLEPIQIAITTLATPCFFLQKESPTSKIFISTTILPFGFKLENPTVLY